MVVRGSKAKKKSSQKKWKLSILMPAYNEEDSIAKILAKIDKVNLKPLNMTKELIIVDDGSKDRTVEIVRKLKKKYKYIRFIRHKQNRGKGGAVKTAIKYATGDICIIQDADLEYDPNDYAKCLRPIMAGKTKVVYGSRFMKKNQNIRYRMNWLATKLLNYLVLFLYFHRITDEPTCYKTFDTKLIQSIRIKGNRFEWEPEVTAKLLKMGHKIHEVPIKYYPRSFEEGKKINWKDGIQAVWTLIKYRFVN